MAKDWNKVGAIAGVVGAVFGGIAVLLFAWQIRLQLQQQQQTALPAIGIDLSRWGPTVVVVTGLLIAAAVQLWALYRWRNRPEKPEGQSPNDVALIQSNARIAELEDAITKLHARDDEQEFLLDIANEQAKAIQNYVSIDCQIANHRLTGDDNLYIHFLFSVDSRCVFKLSLDDDISGSSISFASTRLKHAPVLSDNRVKGLAITHHAKCFEIHQPLTGAEAARLLTEQGLFNFYRVKTSLSCEPDWIGQPVHLELTCRPSLSQEFINSNYRKAFIEITPLPLRTFFRYRKATGGDYDLPTEPLGTVLTMRVKMTPHRSLKLRSFKLFTSGPIVSAETGEIRETPHIAPDGQLVKTGTDYKPNLADLPTVEIDREDTIEGWLQFIVKGVEPPRMLDPATFVVRLHAIDESTEEHWQPVTNLEWVARH